jgi:hypothetical protein
LTICGEGAVAGGSTTQTLPRYELELVFQPVQSLAVPEGPVAPIEYQPLGMAIPIAVLRTSSSDVHMWAVGLDPHPVDV